MIIDLGDVYDLDTISIWNMNASTAQYAKRSVRLADIYVSADPDLASTNTHLNGAAFDSTGWTLLADNLTVSSNAMPATVSSPNALLRGLTQSGRYIAIIADESYGTNWDNKYAALGEVQVFGRPATPAANVQKATPVATIQSSAGSDRGSEFLTDGSGMNSPTNINDWRLYELSADDDNLGKGHSWMANNEADPWVIIDLGEEMYLDRVTFWNMNASADDYATRSVKTIDVYAAITPDLSTTNINNSTAPFSTNGWVLLYDDLAVSSNAMPETINSPNAMLAGLNQPARYIAVEVESVWGGNNKNACLGEIQIFTREPGTPFNEFLEKYGLSGQSKTDDSGDNDGLNNWGEYVFGGDPTDADDLGTQPSFDAATGIYNFSLIGDDTVKAYVVTNLNLAIDSWGTNAVIDVTATDGVLSNYTDNVGTGSDQMFIKLLVE